MLRRRRRWLIVPLWRRLLRLQAVGKGVPVKKLILVGEMSMDADKSLDPARFATTMQSAGLLDVRG